MSLIIKYIKHIVTKWMKILSYCLILHQDLYNLIEFAKQFILID